ncbi:peptidylprolyl isomerase [Roseinatronobacter bogoriensis]|uniref:Parvulin-like PPIase n=2 Tax=Roseinatronobacter bogoriensis TaxID=119542 RepID=A0A2K8K9H5_9RHOB|nr:MULTISPECIES: peptidylprolyl isomerase [Rhodobaca]ATX66107.1 peptidylprolyl isomerase [Rhodobaca barguzinensis]MBB4207132.1 peptidyl-prolyl cis-trans isomerase D [Rhodobaca bogoriensis DSM 18756]TDW40498.1 peptidyl-prolyl cis-trans isomerase D [Rhodobaca barguzinensis]TDY70350.1 peptidyl-prolyl cis-trans isomerase D [Rhodobaca bogoriensis DSM 18756]
MAKTKPKKKMSAKNIAAGFLMALLALSLLGFGVEGFGSRSQNVASVGDRNISANTYARAMQNELRAFQSQMGQALTMEQARLFGLDQMVLEQLVNNAVLDNEAARLGVSAGDTTVQREILQIGAFQGLDGSIDREAYRFALQNAGMNESEFETTIREDVARSILQLSVISGASAPDSLVQPLLDYQAQTRDVTVLSLSVENLAEPVGRPDQATLQAFYEANLDRYTLPEGKRISYAWITPEMVIDTIEVDEAILREAYEARLSEFSQPERRLVERLVFSDMESAEDALARINAGDATFESLVAERGLELEDTDMGDVTRAQLGAAADVVFALEAPGIVGPAETTLGPAIFRMNAILSAQEVTFEQARDQLRDEQLADLARRVLSDDYDLYEDLLAGGATVAQLGQETEMQSGQMDWRPGMTDGIAAYESVRDAAEALQEGDFPEISFMQDGGMFALEYLEALPATPRPLPEIETQVIADWQNERILEGLRAQAEELAMALRGNGDAPELNIAPVRFDGLRRTDIMPDLPRDLVAATFEMDTGEVRIVESANRVHILELHAVESPDLMLDDVADLRSALEMQIEQSIAQDLFGYFSNSLRQTTPIRIDQPMIDAVQANF